MKIFKYLIVGFALLILSLIAIFGIEVNVEPRQDEELVMMENEEVIEPIEIPVELPEIKLELTTELVQTYPFLSLLPEKPIPFDVNRNGFRDDLEIYIAQKFPHSPLKRAVYIQFSSAIHRSAADMGRSKTGRQVTLLKNELLAEKCFLDSGFSEDDMQLVKRLVLVDDNKVEGYAATTEARKEIPLDLRESILLPDNSCDPIIMENERMMQSWVPDQ